MGLFVRRDSQSDSQPLYNTVHDHVALIVGLGNIGKKYTDTRHNIGFDCVDNFAEQQGFPAWSEKKNLQCQITERVIGGTRVVLIKPSTFMNESGQSVFAVQQYFKIPNSDTVVVHDELDINFGQVRTRVGGSAAGNNGIKSIIQHCGEAFLRVRVGIGNEHSNLADSSNFVLSRFNKEEKASLPELYREVSALLSEYTASHELPHDTRNFLI